MKKLISAMLALCMLVSAPAALAAEAEDPWADARALNREDMLESYETLEGGFHRVTLPDGRMLEIWLPEGMEEISAPLEVELNVARYQGKNGPIVNVLLSDSDPDFTIEDLGAFIRGLRGGESEQNPALVNGLRAIIFPEEDRINALLETEDGCSLFVGIDFSECGGADDGFPVDPILASVMLLDETN